MERTIKFAANQLPILPHGLRTNPGLDGDPADEISVNLTELYHHYYLNGYGRRPPNPDPAQFEYLRFLVDCNEMRFTDDFGIDAEQKRVRNFQLGEAFCRWFLHRHFGISFFAKVGPLIGKSLGPRYRNLEVRKVKNGDTPDFFCATNSLRMYVAEAKARITSISFENKEFQTWRNQFQTIQFVENGISKRMKGYIVATRIAYEKKPKIFPGIFCEDPETPGEVEFTHEDSNFPQIVVAEHLGNLADKMNVPTLAAAIKTGTRIPQQIPFQLPVWRLPFEEVRHLRFVGGYFSSKELVNIANDGRFRIVPPDPFNLSSPYGTFFGIEERTFTQMVEYARGDTFNARQLPDFQGIPVIGSNVSLLNDGSILAPFEMMILDDIRTF